QRLASLGERATNVHRARAAERYVSRFEQAKAAVALEGGDEFFGVSFLIAHGAGGSVVGDGSGSAVGGGVGVGVTSVGAGSGSGSWVGSGAGSSEGSGTLGGSSVGVSTGGIVGVSVMVGAGVTGAWSPPAHGCQSASAIAAAMMSTAVPISQ